MTNKHIHIICFDIPYPANYGGVIDVFFKIKALKTLGVNITLHCFVYNKKKKAEELKSVCKEVFYYQRDTSISKHLSILPYAVYSRKNKQLIDNLLQDNAPILFEGLMSCYYLNDKRLKNRRKIFREANIEHDYYKELYKSSSYFTKKLYYLIESIKFKFFEKNIKYANHILAISKTDQVQLENRFPKNSIEFIPCFHSNNCVTSETIMSDYILYHGNLSVAENEMAAVYLCTSVFSKLNCKCIVAGMKPSENLKYIISLYKNIELIANPEEYTINSLIKKAQINVLITFQPTGMKIKLLNAIYSGKHLVVNKHMIAGSDLMPLCHVADTDIEQIEICKKLLSTPFSHKELTIRKKILGTQYDNFEQAKKIASIL